MGAEEGMEGIMLVAKQTDSRDPAWERYGHDHGEVLKEVAKSHRPVTATGDWVLTFGPTGIMMA